MSTRYIGDRLWASRRWLIVAFALLYLTVLFGGASLKTDYSHISQYISELNATNSDWSWLIGFLGFLPIGLLGFVLFLVVAPSARLTGVSQIGYWLLVAEPIVYIGSVFAPCDLGCPSTGSFSQNFHNILSVITLIATILGLILLFFNESLALSKRVGWLALAVMFITLYTLALAPDLATWRGLTQRLAEGILYGCLCLVGWQLLAAQNE